MKSARFFVLAFLILIFAFSTLLYGAVPQMINYQGKITTPAGALIDSSLSMVFSIYDNEPDVSPAWAETLVVQVEKGIFSVVLGNVHPIPTALFDGTVKYLGIKAGTDPEMTPRKEIVSVAYAYHSGADGDWTIDGDNIYRLDGRIGIGTTSPNASSKLHVEHNNYYAGYFKSNKLSGSTHVIHSEFTGSGTYDATAVYGKSTPSDYYGYGGYFEGGYRGVYAQVLPTGSQTYYGVYGFVFGGSGTNYGVYGAANGAGTNYGVYYAGGLGGSGSKSCIVKTSRGPTALYCQESPESWFEDFGEGELINGITRIELDRLFLETVTINDDNPMKVFVQLEGDCNGVYVSKGTTGFDVIELNKGTRSVPFSYRVVAKRKGFEDKRLDYTAAGENDAYLYPEAALRLKKEREKEKTE
jgi:hypothetical protein